MKSEIIYDQLDDIVIKPDEKISDVRLNTAFEKLMQNDITLWKNKRPTIWECFWYNDPSINGYAKGDIIWYNTEDLDSFIYENRDTIYTYMLKNPYLTSKAIKYDYLNKESYDLYVSVINGYKVNDDLRLSPLFDFGKLTDSVQLLVSQIDNNKIIPANDTEHKYWKPFLKHGDNIISSIFDKLDMFNDHIQNYHFGKFSNQSDLKSTFYKNYISNKLEGITNKQQHSGGVYQAHLSGFDSIKSSKYDSNDKCGYILWESGFLECYGTVDVSNDVSNGYKNIEFLKDIKYSYFDVGNDPFYGFYTEFNSIANSDAGLKDSKLSQIQRYNIHITPIIDEYLDVNESSYLAMIPSIVSIRNDGFSIKCVLNEIKQYQYRTTGFGELT